MFKAILKLLYTIFLIVCSISAFSQENINEENLLIEKYKTAKIDSVKFNSLHQLITFYKNVDLEKAIAYSDSMIDLGKKKIDQHSIYTGYNNKAIAHSIKGDLQKSNFYFAKCLEVDSTFLSASEKGNMWNNLGISQMMLGNYEESLKNLMIGLRYRKRTKDLEMVAGSYNNIGLLFYRQGNWNKALEYYKEGLSYSEKLEEKKSSYSNLLDNIGLTLSNMGRHEEAITYFEKALVVIEKNNSVTGKIYNLQYIGDALLALGNYSGAYNIYKESRELAVKINDDYGIELADRNIAGVFIKQGKYKEAIALFEKTNNYFTSIGDKLMTQQGMESLAVAYEKLGDFSNAYKTLQKNIVLKDSLFSENSQKLTNEMEAKFHSAQQKKEIELQNALLEKKEIEVQKQNTFKLLFASGLVLMIALAFTIFMGYNSKRKANHLIVLQKKEVERQKELIEEKQQEILDSITYAKRFQEAILPPITLIHEKLPDSFVYYQPKDIVAGDFYWMELASVAEVVTEPSRSTLEAPKLDKASITGTSTSSVTDTILFAAADCTGHGVPGAMVSLVCANALNRAVKEFGLSEPGKILDKVTDLVIETFEKSVSEVKDGMDISLVSLAYRTKSDNEERVATLQWAGANNPLWVLRSNRTPSRAEVHGERDFSTSLEMTNHESQSDTPMLRQAQQPNTSATDSSHISILNTQYSLQEIKGDKQPIGKYDKRKPFTTHTLELNKGDIIYLFTDGYADQFGGERGKKLKYSRFKEILLDSSEKTMGEQKKLIEKEFNEWKTGYEQLDDVCVIGIKI